MIDKKWISRIYILLIINCIQFLILVNIAILFYPGGTFNNPFTSGYSLWSNLFSDLGRFVAHSGESNIITFLIYNVSLFIMGLLLIPYFIIKPRLFKEKGEGRSFCIAGSILGIPIAISIMGASLTPADLNYGVHVSFGFINFVALLPLAILFAFAIFQNKAIPNVYAYTYVSLAVLLFAFLGIMFFSPNEAEMSLEFAAGQNLIIYAMTLCFLIQGYGGLKLQKSQDRS
jgi:hypothetical membrane protein